MSNKMLIDSSHPEETRVVVTKGNRLEEFDFESQHKKQIRGNIYLAKVTRVEPSLQAAFVDYGGNRHGFLAFSEIHPDYYQIPLADRQALIEEEAALADAEAADEDAEAEARSSKNNKGSGRKRRRRGRRDDRNKNGRSHGGRVPDAEPVAFDAILEAYEARIKEQASEDVEDVAIAAAVEGAATISEEVELDTSADDADAGDNNDNDDEDTSASDDVDVVADDDDAIEDTRPRRRSSRKQYKIQEVIKRRQVILVQVVKEERGNKGAALTTYMSLAGRYSVLMPNTARGGGISRKITVAADRKRLKDMVKGLDVPKGMGVILRTAGANRSREEVTRDYEYLMRLWDNVRDLTLSSSAPSLVYEEGNLIKRSIRDLYNKDISEIRVAGDQGYEQAREFMKMLMPSSEKAVKRWKDASPIFARTGMEAQLDKLMSPEVTLKSGGYIIINQTEALVSIDVNSGKSTRERSIEETAIATNLEAAEEVARQLRLRDLAGLIVIDFIDMEENRNNRAVEKKLKDCLKSDRARIQVGRISHFGLMEMSRQRMRASVLESTMQVCHHCSGTGLLRSAQSIALHVIRSIEDYLIRNSKNHIVVKTTAETAIYVLNEKRETLLDMEKRFGLNITIEIDGDVGAEMFAIERGEVSNLPKREVTHVTIDYDDEEDDNEAAGAASHEDDEQQPKRRRRRRGKKNNQSEDDTAQASDDKSDDESSDENGEGRSKRRRRSRGRRGGRNRRNRYDRIPNAEVVGPMIEIAAAWDAEQTALKEAEAAAASKVDEAQIAETNGEVKEAPVETVAETHSEAQPVEKTDVQVETAEPAIEEAAPKVEVEPVVETSAEEQSTRVRATAANIDLDVEPVIVTESAKPKAKKGGWWSR